MPFLIEYLYNIMLPDIRSLDILKIKQIEENTGLDAFLDNTIDLNFAYLSLCRFFRAL